MDGRMNGGMGGLIVGRWVGWLGWLDGRTDGWMEGRMDGWMDGWIVGRWHQ